MAVEIQKDQKQFESELKITDKLAIGRTQLAQERTLMATIRTSVSLISFGFTIAKFFKSLKDVNMVPEGSTLSSSRLGLWLVIIGTVYLVMSTVQHVYVLKELKYEGMKKKFSITFYLAILISLMGITLIISFYTNILSLGLT